MRIKKLPNFIANQIAAGEVVERPASVLKELMENSVDAKSTNIDVIISKGGISAIQITDNGVGIHKDDLQLACAQHATSKILKTEDLEGITSLGFRGEALASIASVSKFELISKPNSQNVGWKISLSGNECDPTIEPCVHNDGTTTIMRELFFNTPARRHFLRTERTEYFYAEEVFKRVALSNFDVAFSLTHNNKQIFKLVSQTTNEGKLQRIAKIFGRSFIDKSVYIEAKQDDMKLFGWMILPMHAKAQAINQYFYINNRIIKDKLINHAIRQVYQQVGEPGKNPNYCLFLNIDATDLDVNVHPTKHEVRFKKARYVHQFITNSILEALTKSSCRDLDEVPQHEIPCYVRDDNTAPSCLGSTSSSPCDLTAGSTLNLNFTQSQANANFTDAKEKNNYTQKSFDFKSTNSVNDLSIMNISTSNNLNNKKHVENNVEHNKNEKNQICSNLGTIQNKKENDEKEKFKRIIPDNTNNVQENINVRFSNLDEIPHQVRDDAVMSSQDSRSGGLSSRDSRSGELSSRDSRSGELSSRNSRSGELSSRNSRSEYPGSIPNPKDDVVDSKTNNNFNEHKENNVQKKPKIKIELLHVLEQKIALALVNNELIFVDLVDSVKKMVYKNLMEDYKENKRIKSSPLLIPQTISICIKTDIDIDEKLTNLFLNIGFDLECLPGLSGNNVIIRTIPKILINYNINLEKLINNLLNFTIKTAKQKTNKKEQIIDKNDLIFEFIAKETAKEYNISDEHILSLIKMVVKNSNEKNESAKNFNLKASKSPQLSKYRYVTVEDLHKVIKD